MPIQVVATSGNAKTELPLYFGWFVETDYSSSFLNRSRKLFADTLQDIPDFLKDVQNFTQQTYITDILLQYTRENPDEVLHCTAMYNGVYPNYVPGAEEYSEKQVVKVKYSIAIKLIMFTPILIVFITIIRTILIWFQLSIPLVG